MGDTTFDGFLISHQNLPESVLFRASESHELQTGCICKSALNYSENSMKKYHARDHNSPIPFVDSTYGHSFPVQLPPQGSFIPFQTGHASERNNYGGAPFGTYMQHLKAPSWLMSLLAETATINHVAGIKTSFSFFAS